MAVDPRVAQLLRGIASKRWSRSHIDRARSELANLTGGAQPIIPPPLRRQMSQLQRGVSSGRWSASHVARAKQQLADLAARRRHLVENATMYNPAQGLSGESLRNTVDQLTESELAPLRREQQGIAAQGEKSASDIEALYKSLASAMQSSVASSRALNEKGLQASKDIGTAQQQAIGNAGQQAVAGLNDEYAPGARERLATLVASRQGQAADMQAAREQTVKNLGDSNTNFLTELGAAGQLQGAEMGARARSTTASRLADIAGQIADVQGPGRTKLLRQLIGEERQFSTDQAALNQLTPYQAAQVKLGQARNRTTRRGQNITSRTQRQQQDSQVNQWGYTNKEWRSMSPARRQGIIKQQKRWGMKPGGGKTGSGTAGLTPLQRRQVRQNRNKAAADVRATLDAHPNITSANPRGKHLRSQSITTLMQRYGFSHYEAMQILNRVVKLPKPKKRTVAERKIPRP